MRTVADPITLPDPVPGPTPRIGAEPVAPHGWMAPVPGSSPPPVQVPGTLWWERFAPVGGRESDLSRVGADVMSEDTVAGAAEARAEVVRWMYGRLGLEVPEDGVPHRVTLSSGDVRAAHITVETPTSTVTAVRVEEDGGVVEVVVTDRLGWAPTVTARTVSGRDDAGQSTPEPFRIVAGRVRLVSEGREVTAHAMHVTDEADALDLLDLLEDPHRARPVFVLSVPRGADAPLADADALAAATCGNALVIVLPHALTRRVSNRFGESRGVHSGAVRTYMPGFDATDDPRDHPLMSADRLATDAARRRWVADCTALAAVEGMRRLKLGPDMRSYASVESALLRDQAALVRPSGPDDGRGTSVDALRIAALESEMARLRLSEASAREEAKVALSMAAAAEDAANRALAETERLRALLRERGAPEWEAVEPPRDWAGVVEWVDAHLAGRVSLAPLARRQARDAAYEDIGVVHRSLCWLAGRASDDAPFTRLNNVTLESGIQNSMCGGDAFAFDDGGRRLSADWHVKSRSRTYDRRRCLRIYYAWDQERRCAVIADWPSHRPSPLS